MRSDLVSLFKIDPHRSLEAFDALMGDWKVVLISDDYALIHSVLMTCRSNSWFVVNLLQGVSKER